MIKTELTAHDIDRLWREVKSKSKKDKSVLTKKIKLKKYGIK